jgi:hypothetical protein
MQEAKINQMDVISVTALANYRQQLQEQVAEANAAIQATIDRLAREYGIEDAGHGFEIFCAPDGSMTVRGRVPQQGGEHDG